jgi:FemAB-related protein (PEP-CTERM system-associated)
VIKIRLAEFKDQQKWDHYVSSKPNSTAYQLFAWKQAIESTYKHQAYYLIAETKQEICGVLPIIRIKPPFLAAKLCSLPFCDSGGPITEDEETRRALLNHSHQLSQELNAGSFELRESLPNTDETTTEHDSKVSMLLELPSSSEEVLAGFKSKHRSQINKAKKNGLEADFGTSARYIDEFYRVFANNMLRLGSPVHSKSLFINLAKYYDERMILALIKHEGITIAAGIVLRINNRACIPWASTLFEYNKLSPNMLLYWSLLEKLADSNCQLFDFGRSTPGEGTYKFKAQWGAQPQALHWQSFDIHGDVIDNTMGNSKARAVIEQIWQKQPQFTANLLGPAVRKYISL